MIIDAWNSNFTEDLLKARKCSNSLFKRSFLLWIIEDSMYSMYDICLSG